VTDKTLDAEVAKVPEHERVEISQQNLILDVVKDFYFAKYFFLKTNIMDYEGDERLQVTFGYLSEQLLKQAVISVATAIDLTTGKPVDGKKPPGTASLPHLLERIKKTLEDLVDTDASAELDLVEHIRKSVKQAVISLATAIDLTTGKPVDGKKPPGRTASLPHLLERIKKTLEDLIDTDASAELDLVEHIRKSVDPQKHLTLAYVQYMRNKWAGHASLDRRFDTWVQAKDSLSIPAVEAALVRIVNAYEDFSDLVDMSDALTEKTTKPKQVPTINADGHKTWTMTVDWSSIRTWAPVQRESAQKEVDHFFGALSTSVD
jgi:hypothetical protein